MESKSKTREVVERHQPLWAVILFIVVVYGVLDVPGWLERASTAPAPHEPQHAQQKED